MKLRLLALCLIGLSLSVSSGWADQKPKVGPVKVDARSVQVIKKNLGLELDDATLRAMVNISMADLIEIKEMEAPEQPIPEQAVFVKYDNKSYLFQAVAYDLTFSQEQKLSVNCHGWFRGSTDWMVTVDVIASRKEDWARVTELYNALRRDDESFRLWCDGTKLKTVDKYHYAYFTVDLSESDQAVTLHAPNYLAGLPY